MVYTVDENGVLNRLPEWKVERFGRRHFQAALGMVCVRGSEEVETVPIKTEAMTTVDAFYSIIKKPQLEAKNNKRDEIVRVTLDDGLKNAQTAVLVIALLQLASDWEHEQIEGFPCLRIELSSNEVDRVRIFIHAVLPTTETETYSGQQLVEFITVLRGIN